MPFTAFKPTDKEPGHRVIDARRTFIVGADGVERQAYAPPPDAANYNWPVHLSPIAILLADLPRLAVALAALVLIGAALLGLMTIGAR